MTMRDGQAVNHLGNDLLVKAIDDELSPSESVLVEVHLSQCEDCRQRYQELHGVSNRIECLAASIVPISSFAGRDVLAHKIDQSRPKAASYPNAKVLHRFGWGMAIAATLALGIIFAPKKVDTSAGTSTVSSNRRSIETFEVNGETFVALPYSNADLPVSNSHIVEMQVPVSSLTEAGVGFEAISTQQTALDHSVLADVLVGMDGQPLGVHVLSE